MSSPSLPPPKTTLGTLLENSFDNVGSLQLKLQSGVDAIYKKYFLTSFNLWLSVLYKSFPSHNILYHCSLQNFAENKDYYINHMPSLSVQDYISLHHTFKLTSNSDQMEIGCHNMDELCVCV